MLQNTGIYSEKSKYGKKYKFELQVLPILGDLILIYITFQSEILHTFKLTLHSSVLPSYFADQGFWIKCEIVTVIFFFILPAFFTFHPIPFYFLPFFPVFNSCLSYSLSPLFPFFFHSFFSSSDSMKIPEIQGLWMFTFTHPCHYSGVFT